MRHFKSTLGVLYSVMFLGNINVYGQQERSVTEDSVWSTYGYIGIGSFILILIVIVLMRRQSRRFND